MLKIALSFKAPEVCGLRLNVIKMLLDGQKIEIKTIINNLKKSASRISDVCFKDSIFVKNTQIEGTIDQFTTIVKMVKSKRRVPESALSYERKKLFIPKSIIKYVKNVFDKHFGMFVARCVEGKWSKIACRNAYSTLINTMRKKSVDVEDAKKKLIKNKVMTELIKIAGSSRVAEYSASRLFVVKLLLTNGSLTNEEIVQRIKKTLEASDIDKDKKRYIAYYSTKVLNVRVALINELTDIIKWKGKRFLIPIEIKDYVKSCFKEGSFDVYVSRCINHKWDEFVCKDSLESLMKSLKLTKDDFDSITLPYFNKRSNKK